MTVLTPSRQIDRELALWLALTRRLPRVRGAGRLLNLAKRVYTRKRRDPVIADVYGSRMVLDPGEFVDRSLLFGPQFLDVVERRCVTERLLPGDAFADVGAHIGYYSLLAAKAVGAHGRVLAIEADPVNYAHLVENLRLNDARHVIALNVGVADDRGPRLLGLNDRGNRGGNSFLVRRATTIEVMCETLYTLLASQGLRTLAGMKLDIEGLEYRVLARFLREAPEELRPRFIIIEHNPTLFDVAGGDALELLKRHGYRVDAVADLNYVLTLEGSDERRAHFAASP